MPTIDQIRRSNLLVLIQEHGTSAALAKVIGKSDAQISQWKTAAPNSRTGRARGIADDTCRLIEQKTNKPMGWMDVEHFWGLGSHATAGPATPEPDEAHSLSLDVYTVPSTIPWEVLMQTKELPQEFVVAMPDDALLPKVARGTKLIFERSDVLPEVGTGVLVEDGAGRRYVRRFGEAPGGGWRAQALNDAYASLESAKDNIRVLAVVVGVLDGRF